MSDYSDFATEVTSVALLFYFTLLGINCPFCLSDVISYILN